jgi:two-component SAPR family response regulator
VRLHEAVEVDVRRCVAQASQLIAGDEGVEPEDIDLSALRGDLLPGWDEDWLLLERERVRQIQIRALEALAHRLCRLGRHVEAIDAAFAAIAEEPLRESAHAALIDVYLAERDVAQARHQFERYAALLWSELAIKPSDELTNRVAEAAG